MSGEWKEEKNEGEKRRRGGFEKWEDRTSLLPGRYRHRPGQGVYCVLPRIIPGYYCRPRPL